MRDETASIKFGTCIVFFSSGTSAQSPTIDTRTETSFTAKLGDQLSEMSGLTDQKYCQQVVLNHLE